MYECHLMSELKYDLDFQQDKSCSAVYGAIAFEPKKIILYNVQKGTQDPQQISQIERILREFDIAFAREWLQK